MSIITVFSPSLWAFCHSSLNPMASTASHFFLSLAPNQRANTKSSRLHCFQSFKFISGQRRSPRACADSAQVMDQLLRATTTVEVDLGNRSYPIYNGSGLLHKPELLQRHAHGKRALVVTNNTVAPLYLDKVTDALTRGNANISVDNVILPDGEQYKNMDALMKVMSKAPRPYLAQPDTFVALGGGVIPDICGFATSLFIRGADYIQIPTTLVAQVDSSVGGKTGINPY